MIKQGFAVGTTCLGVCTSIKALAKSTFVPVKSNKFVTFLANPYIFSLINIYNKICKENL